MSNNAPASFLARILHKVAKLLVRGTEISHLHYSPMEIVSIVRAIGFDRKKHDVELAGYKVQYLDADSFKIVASEVFVQGEYYFQATHDAPVIFDCGANIGLATLFLKRLYPKARIHSFEADPATFEVLRLNIERNDLQDITVTNLLLSDHDGVEKFYIPLGTPGSLMMSATSSRLGADAREISVKAGRLSDYIDGPIDLLKLDVEGSEFGVIRELIASGKIGQISRMYIEYHHKIGDEPSCLSNFLAMLERTGLEYHIEARIDRTAASGGFQDVFISAYRP